jgi:potassium efflux system protein
LGFGLQEIIANFFCGIILLFERPIRIGDVVKVGDVVGTVSSMRIRATTITDWDRMEYIVPNKELITGRVFNWTLSDTLNRVVIKVGIQRTADPERARELLLKVAAAHPKVRKDPSPIATLEGFETNSLALILRCYIAGFTDRIEVIGDLHMAITKAFADAGIELGIHHFDVRIRDESSGGTGLDVPGEGR